MPAGISRKLAGEGPGASSTSGTLAVRGLAPMIRDFDKLSRDGLSHPLRSELKRLAEPVARTARHRADEEGYGCKTVTGLQAGVRYATAVVRQQNRKTTGKHPEFGDLQMRKVLLPALREHEPEIVAGVEKLLDRMLGGRSGTAHLGRRQGELL